MTGRRIHGMSKTPIYWLWMGMKERCRNPNHIVFKRYGANGIKVCERWKSFENFYADMGDKPKGKTLDRVNNDGDYSPDNCKWSSYKEQANNRSNSISLELNGKRMSLLRWAEKIGIKPDTLYKRVDKGWPVEKVLSRTKFIPKRPSK